MEFDLTSSEQFLIGLLLQTVVLGFGLVKVFVAGKVRNAAVSFRLYRIEERLGIDHKMSEF